MKLVFNELSLNETMAKRDGIQRFCDFLNTYSHAVKNGFGRAVLTYIDFNAVPIADGYYSFQWRNSETDRDMVRRFQGLCERQNLCGEQSLTYEAYVEGRSGKGILHSVLHDEILFSICGQEAFEKFCLPATLFSLEEEKETTVEIINISSCADVDDNVKLWKNKKINEIQADADVDNFIGNLSQYYPSLVFGKVALRQLRNDIERQHFKTVREKLYEIENVFHDWDGGEIRNDMFSSKMTPESPETLKAYESEHTFEVNDEVVVASYHIRYTGNIAGRIYFYPESRTKKCYICSLTTKLPTVSEPKMKA